LQIRQKSLFGEVIKYTNTH